MIRTTSKKSIARLALICRAKGVHRIVFSPGSRNAPLVIAFANDPAFHCVNIPDERTAAFFALGWAQQCGEPVAICCTSGSAALNYAPAVSEAYYQRVPLIVLTADRPVEWIDQRAGQTMRQNNVYNNYIKKSYQLLEEAEVDDHLWYNDRIVNEAINTARSGPVGPVHINLPLKEPLYDQIDQSTVVSPKIINLTAPVLSVGDEVAEELRLRFDAHDRILILCGQHPKDETWTKAIKTIAQDSRVLVLSESSSNLADEAIIPCIDRTIHGWSSEDKAAGTPTLLISCGGSIVSKKIRFLLREMNIQEHWHVSAEDGTIDTYQQLTDQIQLSISTLVDVIAPVISAEKSDQYNKWWMDLAVHRRERHESFLTLAPWSDLQAIAQVVKALPKVGVQLHLANSTSIRYIQLFDTEGAWSYHCNRGVSGIDGCTSTAVGYSYQSDDLNVLITGDVAFFYDSNAFWHQQLRPNLKVILLNNQGGNIFRFIPGPGSTEHLARHFEAHHRTSAQHLCEMHGVSYMAADSTESLVSAMNSVIADDVRPGLIEVFTPREENDKILKAYFDFLIA